jgi:hypothetical protein
LLVPVRREALGKLSQLRIKLPGGLKGALLAAVAEPRRVIVNHRGTLARPLLLGHRPIADQILAQHVLELLAVAPVLPVSVLESENSGSDIGHDVFTIRHLGDATVLVAENFDGVCARNSA